MDLSAIEAGWDQAAAEDPMHYILTIPGTENGAWDPADFYAHGEAEIDHVIARLEGLGIKVGGRALDFGCGVGRLTEALARHYERVDGVDVSSEMLWQARARKARRCTYHHNAAPDLGLFPDQSFDLVYSMIVLQHMPAELQHGYIAEFLRILKPTGAATFEIPDGGDYQHTLPWLSMYGTPAENVHLTVEQNGGRVLDVELIDEPSQWSCYRYTAVRAR